MVSYEYLLLAAIVLFGAGSAADALKQQQESVVKDFLQMPKVENRVIQPLNYPPQQVTTVNFHYCP